MQVKQLLSFSGNLSLLPEADQFMVQLVKVPGWATTQSKSAVHAQVEAKSFFGGGIFSYEERLKMMVLREEFFPLMEEVENSVSLMIKGANGNIFLKSTQSS